MGVGIFIEEEEIVDLDEAITTNTHNDIRTVYGNLQSGSYHHPDGFKNNLKKISKGSIFPFF